MNIDPVNGYVTVKLDPLPGEQQLASGIVVPASHANAPLRTGLVIADGDSDVVALGDRVAFFRNVGTDIGDGVRLLTDKDIVGVVLDEAEAT